MVEKIAPREVSSAKSSQNENWPELGSVKSDFYETLHAQSYMSEHKSDKT